MIKAVLFDYGGVLTESGKVGGIQRALGKVYGIDPASIEMADLHYRYIRGLMTEAQFFAELNHRYAKDVPATRELFEAENSGFFAKCQPVYDLAARLRATGLKTGILSNIYPMSAKSLRAQGFYDRFDPVVLSCEEHVAKPELAIFETALKRLDLPGNEVLFIDDQERFREPAEALGLRFIVAESPQQIVDDVTALIKKENNLTIE